jgi:hypothetical protein
LAAIDAARAAIRATVHPHFSELSRDNAEGTIRAAGERIVMIRADALSVGLMDYFAGGGRTHWDEGAWAAAGNTLYQLARSLGTRDARACRERDGRLDPMSHCLWGCEQFAATGWARVDFSTPGIFEPTENMHSIFDHMNSFEAEAWLKRREQDATRVSGRPRLLHERRLRGGLDLRGDRHGRRHPRGPLCDAGRPHVPLRRRGPRPHRGAGSGVHCVGERVA